MKNNKIVLLLVFLLFFQISYAQSWVEVYRGYLDNSPFYEHLYTKNLTELQPPWQNEGVAFYVSTSAFSNSAPVYRLRKDGSPRLRLLTTSETEKNSAIANGYVLEETLGYIYASSNASASEIFRVFKSSVGDRLYTANYAEAFQLVNNSGYIWESHLGYAPVFGSITGGVRDAYNNNPLGNATVRLKQGGVTKYQVMSNPISGVYQIDQVIPGDYELEGSQAGYINLSYSVTISQLQTLTGQNLALPRLPAPVLVYPINGQTVTVPSSPGQVILQWQLVNNATGYQLKIDELPLFDIAGGNTSSYTATLNPGPHYWMARTKNINGDYGDWSGSENFTITVSALPPPTLVSPINNQTVTVPSIPAEVQLEWQQVSGALGYQLDVDGNPVNIFSGSQTTYTATGLGPDYHQWRARTEYSSGQYGSWSNYEGFNIELSVNAPTLISPIQNSSVTSETILFEWSDVGAIDYEIQIDDDPNFNSIEKTATVTSNSYTLEEYFLGVGFQYHWRVQANFASGPPEISNAESFYFEPIRLSNPYWIPLYRLYKSSDKDHFYCTTNAQRLVAINDGYAEEGIEGHVSAKPFNDPDMVSIYRLYKGDPQKTHFYTKDNNARNDKIVEGYTYEGVVGFAYSSPAPERVPLYHLYKNFTTPAGNVDNFYTISWGERTAVMQEYQFNDGGITAYLSPNSGGISEPISLAQLLIGLGINVQNGNFSFPMRTSFNIPGKGAPLTFTHIYNSLSTILSTEREPLSPGWSHTYNAYVVAADPTATQTLVSVHWQDGSIHEYYKNGSTYTLLTKGVYDDFEEISFPLHFRIIRKDQTVYDFQIPVGARWGSPALLSSITDRNNNTITCQYTAVNSDTVNLTKVIGTSGRELNFSYYTEAGKKHLIQQVTDPIMRSIQFQYDTSPMPKLVQFTDAENKHTQYEYDAVYQLLNKIILPRGNITTIENTYDIIQIGNSWLPVLTSQRLNNQSNPLTILNYGDLISNPNTLVVDPNQNQWTIVSDANYRLNEILNNVFGTVYKVDIWDANHPQLPQQVSDGRGYTSTFTYDSKANILDIFRPENTAHHFQYNFRNDITQYTNPRSKSTSYNYDGNGNLTSVTNPRGTTAFTRTGFGKIETVTNPMGHTYTFGYNNFGNIQSITDPLSNNTSFTYDDASRLKTVTNARNYMTEYDYNPRDLVTTVTDALQNPLNLTYDDNGNLTRVVNARGGATDLGYDNQDRLNSFSNPGQSATTYTYDNDNLEARHNPDNSATSYTYDDMSRLKTLNANNVSATFNYDDNNNITSVIQPGVGNGTMSFGSYDGLNRMTQYTDFYGNALSYGYDANNNITSITYPGNKTVYYTYYDDDLLWTVRDWNNKTTTYTYRDDGSLNSISYPNGVTCTYSYDNADRVDGKSVRKSNGEIIAEYSFELDELGNHTRETVQAPLSVPVIPTASVSYNYDLGNRILNADDITFGFDPNGNMTSRTRNSITTTYSYDGEFRLTGISGADNAAYVYDVFGNRRQAVRNGVTTRYVVDINNAMSQVLMETDGNNNPRYYYIYGLGLVARIGADGTTTRYYHSDFRGSTVAMSDPNQNITHQYAYSAFGEVLDQVEEDANPFRYVGTYGVIDEGNGLYFMRARYYDPEIGRFLSEDPVWDANLYVYADGNSINFIDPNGMNSGQILTSPDDKSYLNNINIDEKIAELQYWMLYKRSQNDAVFVLSSQMIDTAPGAGAIYLDLIASFEQSFLIPMYKLHVLEVIKEQSYEIYTSQGIEGVLAEIHSIRMEYDRKYRQERGVYTLSERLSIWTVNKVKQVFDSIFKP